MKLGDILASFFSREPEMKTAPTRLLTEASIPPRTKGGLTMNRMNKETLNQIIQAVENDPLAGMGSLSKRDILIDRLLAHWNTVETPTVRDTTAPKPIITPPTKPVTLSGGNPPPNVQMQNAVKATA